MSIMNRLKSETADLHAAAEGTRLQRRLVKGDLPRELYAAFLGQMYLIHASLDQAIGDVAHAHPGFAAVVRDYHERETPLRNDLAFFDADARAVTPLPATAALLADIERCATERPVALLGMLYVMEGSTNGSKFIARAIRKAYRLEQGPGVSYLDPHGDRQRQRWQAFKDDMDGVGFNEAESDEIVEAAKDMFRSITEVSDELSELVVAA